MSLLTEEKAESPFFAGTRLQFAWDSVSLNALKKCPRYYQLTILEGWRKREESVHLTFGLYFQAAKELFDKELCRGASYDDALDSAVALALTQSYGWKPDHDKKNRETLLRSLIWHCENYRNYPQETVILEDGTPAIELSFKMEAPIQDFLLCGHLDKMILFDKTPYVLDHKTTAMTISSYYFKQFDPDGQMTQYTIAGKVIYNVPVQGVIIDATQITVGFTAFSRGMTLRSDGQLREWLHDFETWMKTAERYADTNEYPMNEQSCGNYGGCAFRDICSKDPSVREIFLNTDFERRPWNPLVNR